MDILALRRELQLTQAELATRMGLHQATISRLETGTMQLDRRTELALLALRDGKEARAS